MILKIEEIEPTLATDGSHIWDTDTFIYYKCDRCEEEFTEMAPHYHNNDYHLCLDCAFIKGKIEEKKYLNLIGVSGGGGHTIIKNGEICTWIGKAPWEPKKLRNSNEYKEWREAVFKRDKYTCQNCGQIGGELNAHHRKSFKKYPKLRLIISNGKTLCIDCHRQIKRGKNGIAAD